MQFETKFHIFNRFVKISIALLLIQQLIVASSTIWITRLIAYLQLGNVAFLFLGLYLLSLFLPYFPGAAALIVIARAKVRANVEYVEYFSTIYRGNVFEWSNRQNQLSKLSILTSEASQTINSFLDYVYHLASSSLNVMLNLLALAIIVEPLLLASYGLGITLAFLILKFQKKYKKILALKAQQSRIKWVGMLWKAWDNILLNNYYNYSIWKSRSYKRARRLIGSSVKLQKYTQLISISMAFALLMPSFGLIIYLIVKRAHELTWIATLIVVLPRLFQVLTYSYEMLFVLSELPNEVNRFKTIQKALQLSKGTVQEFSKRIQWEKISAKKQEVSVASKQLIENLPHTGRITLKGENGCGKSSLLLMIKHLKGDSAFYLPAKHDLIFKVSKDHLSTGQNARSIVQELIFNLNVKFILLDEWDANLDTENAANLSTLIDEVAQKACVIESRHVRSSS